MILANDALTLQATKLFKRNQEIALLSKMNDFLHHIFRARRANDRSKCKNILLNVRRRTELQG